MWFFGQLTSKAVFIQREHYKINQILLLSLTMAAFGSILRPQRPTFCPITNWWNKVFFLLWLCSVIPHSGSTASAHTDGKVDMASSPSYLSFFSSSWLMCTSCPEASWDFLDMDSSSASTRVFSLARASARFSPERTLPSSAGEREN